MSPGKVTLIALATVVIFAAGVITGGLLVRKTSHTPAGIPFLGRVEMMNRAASQLDLTPGQRERIEVLVRNSREQIADYFMILEPDVQQVFRNLREQIRTELNPDQRQRFEEQLRKRNQRQTERRDARPADRDPSPTPP